MGMISTMRPGRWLITRTRSDSAIASTRSCVTKSAVLPVSHQRAAEILLQHHLRLRIEGREGLVHEQNRGIDGERARKRRALAHAAGELMGKMIGEIRQAALLQQRLGDLAPLRARHAADLQPDLDVLADRAPRQKQVLLQHEGDVFVRLRHLFAVDENLAFGRRIKTRPHVEQRALAAARTDR